MEPFGLVARIGNQRVEPLMIQRRQKRLLVFGVIELRAAVDDSAKNEMIRRVADG